MKYPFNKTDKNDYEEVYAGPEYFARSAPDSPEEDAPLPEEDEENAKTQKFIPPPPQMMAVYAGPDFFSGKQPAGAYVPLPDNKKRCRNCGALTEESFKFCSNCGIGLKK